MVSVSCFGVRVLVMFHFMFVHYTFAFGPLDLSSNAVSIWTGFRYCCGDKSSLKDAFSISRL